MKLVKVSFDGKQWIYENDGKIKEFPMEIIAVNRAKFDARNQRPVHLVIEDKDGKVLVDLEVTDENASTI